MTIPSYHAQNSRLSRRLQPGQIALIAVLAGVLGLCQLGGLAALAPADATAKGGQASASQPIPPVPTTVPGVQAPSEVTPVPTPTPASTFTPPPPTPKSTPTPRRTPSRTPTRAPTTTKPAPDRTHSGTITPGAFCKSVEHFWYGVSAAGKLYRCLDHNGWRWVPV